MSKNLFNLILLVVTGAFAITFYVMIIQLYPVESDNKATIIAGVLGMIGGFAGAIGAYIAAKIQITSQIEQLKLESKKKARPFITCSDIRAEYDLSDVKTSEDAMIIEFDYYNKLKLLCIGTGNKAVFTLIKFYGPEIIVNCEINLFLNKKKYEKHHYRGSLEFLKSNVEVYIPIPYTLNPIGDAFLDRLEFSYETIENEKFTYEYNFVNLYQKLTLMNGDFHEVIYKTNFESTNWILPGKKNK